MFQNRSVNVHDFAMIPNADVPRSSFVIEKAHKTTFDAGYLIPIYLDEMLPRRYFQHVHDGLCPSCYSSFSFHGQFAS